MIGRDAYCTYCGARFQSHLWPRTCAKCRNVSYRNPLPVAVALVPVDGGLLAIRRAREPQHQRFALPGGFIEWDETWQTAIARELREETGVLVDAAKVREWLVRSTDDGKLLVFGITEPIRESDLPPFVSNDEVELRTVLRAPEELVFALHTEAAQAFFERLRS